MKPLFNLDEIYLKGYAEKLFPFECLACNKPFFVLGKRIKHSIKYNINRHICCNSICAAAYRHKDTRFTLPCGTCGKLVSTTLSVMKNSKCGLKFCSSHCSAVYNNAHKTVGTRRSKLKIWLEEKLKETYPELETHFNRKDAINSELDIYIPSLKLAVELNGIFHYEPIYGVDKLSAIQNNDNRKFQACLERGIELIIIDTSQLLKFKEHNALVYLNIIKDIINLKSVGYVGIEPTAQIL